MHCHQARVGIERWKEAYLSPVQLVMDFPFASAPFALS
jgi:hypothetical protein